jgi:hypothetical protein
VSIRSKGGFAPLSSRFSSPTPVCDGVLISGNIRFKDYQQKEPNLSRSDPISVVETRCHVARRPSRPTHPGTELTHAAPQSRPSGHADSFSAALRIISCHWKSIRITGVPLFRILRERRRRCLGRMELERRKLTVRNDRFGFLPVYYAQLPSGFGVSTSALELIRAGAATTLMMQRSPYLFDSVTTLATTRHLKPCVCFRPAATDMVGSNSFDSNPGATDLRNCLDTQPRTRGAGIRRSLSGSCRSDGSVSLRADVRASFRRPRLSSHSLCAGASRPESVNGRDSSISTAAA